MPDYGRYQLSRLSVGEIGQLAAILDDCGPLGDDDATDHLCQAGLAEGVFTDEAIAHAVAYHLIHGTKRRLAA